MCDFLLPARLDHLFEEVSPGAVFKSLDDDRRAMMVEWMEDGETLVVVMPPKKMLNKGGRLPKPSQYKVGKLKPGEFKSWLVLFLGTNMGLIP